jgi:hypothetical protein
MREKEHFIDYCKLALHSVVHKNGTLFIGENIAVNKKFL